MRLKFFKNKDTGGFDWIDRYLDDIEQVPVNPYLWTRIKTRLLADEKPSPGKYTHLVHVVLKAAFTIGLFIIMTMGVLIGKEISSDFCRQTDLCVKKSRIAEDENISAISILESDDELIRTSDILTIIPEVEE
ncbi:MAG: hypothetical protein Kow0042_05260 [Calditrichia bacterium]